MKLKELLHRLPIKPQDDASSQAVLQQEISHVTLDSRSVKPGTVFIACAGATSTSKNGHTFIPNAIKRGALAIISDTPKLIPEGTSVPIFTTDNARLRAAQMIETLAGSPSSSLTLCGVTGTNGKTTVTFLVSRILEEAGFKSGIIGTLGYGAPSKLEYFGYTTPEAEQLTKMLASLKSQNFTHIAMEVSSIALTTHRASGLQFAVAALTNLASDHLDFHHTIESYHEAKKQFFTALLPEGNPAVLPSKHAWIKDIQAYHPIVTWGTDEKATVQLMSHQLNPMGWLIDIRIGQVLQKIQTSLIGIFNLDNILCASACAYALGLSAEQIAAGLTKAKSVPGRLELVHTENADNKPRVFVDFAHTPDALEKSLLSLKPVAHRELIAVFGCGGNRDAQKRPVMGRIAAEFCTKVFLTSDNPRYENPMAILQQIEEGFYNHSTPHFVVEDRKEAIKQAILSASKDDVIIIAGKGHEKTQQIEDDFFPFDDVTIAQHILDGYPL